MAGEVEDDDVPVLGLVERRLEPSQDVLLRRALIHDDADVVVRHPEDVLQRPPHERDVVHATAQRRDVRALVGVDSDQDGPQRGHTVPSLGVGTTVTSRRSGVNEARARLTPTPPGGVPSGHDLRSLRIRESSRPPVLRRLRYASGERRRGLGVSRSGRPCRRSSATSSTPRGARRVSTRKPFTVRSLRTSIAFGRSSCASAGPWRSSSAMRSVASSALPGRTATTRSEPFALRWRSSTGSPT